MKYLNPRFGIAMKEYESGQFTNAQLAERHNVTQATISHWAKKAGLPPKRRGRQRLSEPTATHRRMLELSSDMTIEQIAQKFNVSRQRAHQILKRWSDLRPVRIQAAEVRRTPVSVRRTRVIKDTVVSFRLSSPQIDRINEVLRTLELPRRVSRSQACRLFLLAAIGFTPVTLVVPHVQSDVALAATHGRDDQHIEFKNGGMH